MSQRLHNYRATVLRVVDADTLDLDVDLGFHLTIAERFRVMGIDAWEVRGEEREKGLAAKARVEELCPVGSQVYIESWKQGSFRRWLATIWIDQGEGKPMLSLSEVLLEEGHAEPYKR